MAIRVMRRVRVRSFCSRSLSARLCNRRFNSVVSTSFSVRCAGGGHPAPESQTRDSALQRSGAAETANVGVGPFWESESKSEVGYALASGVGGVRNA